MAFHMNSRKKCCWVIESASQGVDAVYCDSPVKFRILKDDDQNKIRSYDMFCEKHQKLIIPLEDDEDYD